MIKQNLMAVRRSYKTTNYSLFGAAGVTAATNTETKLVPQSIAIIHTCYQQQKQQQQQQYKCINRCECVNLFGSNNLH